MRLSAVLGEKPRRVIGLGPTAPLIEAAALMKHEAVGAVVVWDEHRRMLGLLSERDLALAIVQERLDLFQLMVSDLMNTGAPTGAPTDSVRDVVRLMTNRRARHLPVIDDGRVVGVVSIGDLLKSRIMEKTQENAVLQDLARAHLAA